MAALRTLRLGGTTKALLDILKEIDLGAIEKDAELPLRVRIVGEGELPERLAALLGEPPWVSAADAHPDDAHPDDTHPDDTHPGDIVVWIGRSAHAAPPDGALVVRLGEDADGAPGRTVLSALDAQAVSSRLAPALFDATPERLHLSLARHLPALRAEYARALIEKTSRSNAIFAASSGVAEMIPLIGLPVAVADIVILTKNQLVMAFKLALAAGKRGRPDAIMKEVISVLGSGFLFRQVARELIGLVPVWGLIPKVAVSYAGTLVIGRVVNLWANEGEVPPLDEVRRSYQDALDAGRALAERVVARVRRRGPTRRAFPALRPRSAKERPKRLEPFEADPSDPNA